MKITASIGSALLIIVYTLIMAVVLIVIFPFFLISLWTIKAQYKSSDDRIKASERNPFTRIPVMLHRLICDEIGGTQRW